MNPKKEIRQNILEYARDRFMKCGFSRISTGMIASELGISKKTLYKCFSSKEKLVQLVVENFANECFTAINLAVSDKKPDFTEKIKKIMSIIAEQYSKISEPFAHDLKRSMPGFYKKMLERRREVILNEFGALVKEGIRKKVFRKDFNPEVLLMIYLNAVQNIIVPENLSRFSLSASQLYEMIVRTVYEGIMTDDARKKYLKYHG